MADAKTKLDLVSAPRVQGTAVVVSLCGELNLDNSSELRDALLGILAKHSPKKFVLNLKQVPYMDSSAVAVLVELLQNLRKRGGKLMLSELHPRVKGLLEIVRLDSILGVVATDAEALAQ